MNCLHRPIAFILLGVLVSTVDSSAQESVESAVKTDELTFVTDFKHDALQRPASVAVSRDGKFIYAAGYGASSCLVLKHDRETETLQHVQTIADDKRLQATTSLRLSNDDRFAVTASIGSSAVSLFARNDTTGELTLLDSKNGRTDPEVSGMDFVVEASFSYDDRFVNVLDDTGGVTVFRVVGKAKDRRLEFVEAVRSDDLRGARGLAHHPYAPYLFVACKKSRCVVALEQDTKHGTLEIVDVKRHDQDGIRGLHSAFGVTTSDTGEFVYSVSGHGHPNFR